MLKEINDNNYKDILQNNNNLIIVDFWASWCGPCKSFLPIIENLASEYNNANIEFYKCNIDDNPEFPSAKEIRSIPTIILFKNNKEIERNIGLLTKDKFKELIEKHK